METAPRAPGSLQEPQGPQLSVTVLVLSEASSCTALKCRIRCCWGEQHWPVGQKCREKPPASI